MSKKSKTDSTAPYPKLFLSCMRLAVIALCVLFYYASDSHAQTHEADLGESTIHIASSSKSIAPGNEFLLGAHINLDAGWHTYTYDPGDAGIPFSVVWELPEGFTVSDTHWPPHQIFDEAGLTTNGYSDEVIFTYKVTAPSSIPENTTINAKISYLICEEICIPQTAQLALDLPKGDGSASKAANTLDKWHGDSKLAEAWKAENQSGASATDASATDADGNTTHHADHQHADDASANISSSTSQQPYSLITYVLFALLGGLILNLMPCVFPVLSLKALAIAKHAESAPKEVRTEGLLYTLGILTCFWVLAGILIGIQETGEAIGWGFQFQSPGFVAIMALLFFFIGMNLTGLFEVPMMFSGLVNKVSGGSFKRKSYLTGLLAALVATPCTAPFMATAIGFALSQSPIVALTIFTFLGLGLALPFILISYCPALLKRMPKPGAWMETFKKVLAFPMYLSAIWLLWILGAQSGMEGIIITMITALIIIFLVWARSQCNYYSRLCGITNLIIIALLLWLLTNGLVGMQSSKSTSLQSNSMYAMDFSTEKLAELRAKGTPVFVNATASWCITCQVNYRIAISDKTIQKAMKAQGIVYMVADWTNRNDEITEYLTSYGYKGVPLYVYYAPGRDGVVLPQLLTPGLILETIALSNNPVR